MDSWEASHVISNIILSFARVGPAAVDGQHLRTGDVSTKTMFGVCYAEFDRLNKRFRLTDLLPKAASLCCRGAFSLLHVTGIEEIIHNVFFSFSSSNPICTYCPLVDGNDFDYSRLDTAIVHISGSIMCPSFVPTKLCLCSNSQKRSPEAVKHHLQRQRRLGRPDRSWKRKHFISHPSPLVFQQHRLTPGPVFLHNDVLGASVCCHDV